MSLGIQVVWLLLLALPIACVAWTITHEDIFREPRAYCERRSQTGHLLCRKLFFIFTCEYCLSHYVTIFFLFVARYKLLFDDWRGYLIGGFALVWVANQYMSIYGRLRLDIRRERVEIKEAEQQVKAQEESLKIATKLPERKAS
jgi:hypothetical protein